MPSDRINNSQSISHAVAAASPAPPHGASRHRNAHGMGDRFAFARGFVAHPAQVGSVVPSSTFLEQRLVRAANLEQARTVVELGPGTGGTTRALLHALRPDARLLAIELSAAFHVRLLDNIADPRLAVQLGAAEQLAEYLRNWRLPAADVVLSGIPFSTMPVAVARRTAAAIADNLAAGGRFVAYQARAHVVRFIAPLLGPPTIRWEWRNVPPLRVFRWTRPER
jgi:phosphatidylethanolamine/phosphatidyl-N-methylethanolamine N-methyltransferase